MRRRQAVGGTGGVPLNLSRFDPAEWPSVTDPAVRPGTAYGESMRLWEAAWDAWQGGDPGRGAEIREVASQAAWGQFPDDPFFPDEI